MLTEPELRLIELIQENFPEDHKVRDFLLRFVVGQCRGSVANRGNNVAGDGPTDTEVLDWLERNEGELRPRGGDWDVCCPKFVTADKASPRAAIWEAMRINGDL